VTVLAQHRWKSNAELIADVAKLGYIGDMVLDATYGKGTFWKVFQPEYLWANVYGDKLHIFHGGYKTELHVGLDFTNIRPYEDGDFDTVVLDGPYKLNGTPDPKVDERYGVHEPTRWQDRMALIHDGIAECARVLKPGGTFLLKCQDQVVSGHMVWQTDEFTATAEKHGLKKIDRFDLIGKGRKQPMAATERVREDGTVLKRKARKQRHAHGRGSSLLVFRKVKP